jgi:hypothetical protein
MSRWFLSQFYSDGASTLPVCLAYSSGQWHCPVFPSAEDGWALVEASTSPVQIEAAKQDPRVLVCPLTFDPSPVDQRIIDAYTSRGAATGMSMGALMAKLCETEPCFGQTFA